MQPPPDIIAAVLAHDVERLRRLLDAGADPNTAAVNGTPVLCQAVVEGDAAVVALLVERGADVHRPTAPARGRPAGARGPMYERLRRLERKLRLRPSERMTGRARGVLPLSLAQSWDRAPIAEILLAHGADPDVVDQDGVPLLCRAIEAGQMEIARSLLAHGADVRRAGRNGTTALHLAMERDLADLARTLIERGADPHARDDDGFRPLDLAVGTDTVAAGIDAPVDPADLAALVAGQTAFAGALYARCARDGENLFLSPASVSAALTVVWAGAAGETRRELAEALRLPALAVERLDAAAGALAALSNAAPGVTLDTATALFAEEGGGLRPEFAELVASRYRAEVRPVDFADPARTAAAIERWVQKRTRGRIAVRGADLIGPGTVLVLLNAIYFRGTWANKFDADDTRTAPFFHLDGSHTPARFMFQCGSFSLVDVAGGRALELPYKGGAISMVVVLPDRVDGLPAMEAGLPDILARCAAEERVHPAAALGGSHQKVEVYLPRFCLEHAFDLTGVLAALGARRVFGDQADLSGAGARRAGEPPLRVSRVEHKAWVEVDEEGTTAAAVTCVTISFAKPPPPPPPPVFRADHPFLFLIRDRRTQLVLFLGRVMTIPTESSRGTPVRPPAGGRKSAAAGG